MTDILCPNKHPKNKYLDQELKHKLLSADDEAEEVDERRRCLVGSSLSSTLKASLASRTCDLGDWNEDISGKGKKPERIIQKATKETGKPLVIEPWNRDHKLKEIAVPFKHYSDCQKYIEQYRYEHTYNFGPYDREGMETLSVHGAQTITAAPQPLCPSPRLGWGLGDPRGSNFTSRTPIRSSNHYRLKSATLHRLGFTPTSSNTQTPRVRSAHGKANILDVAHIYKLSPSAIKEAQRQVITDVDEDVVTERLSRQSSQIAGRVSNTATPVRLIVNSPSKQQQQLPQQQQHQQPAESPCDNEEEPVSVGSVFHGKTMKQIPSNGITPEPPTNPTSPTPCKSSGITLPPGVRTMDLLSHVNTTEKQAAEKQDGAVTPSKPLMEIHWDTISGLEDRAETLRNSDAELVTCHVTSTDEFSTQGVDNDDDDEKQAGETSSRRQCKLPPIACSVPVVTNDSADGRLKRCSSIPQLRTKLEDVHELTRRSLVLDSALGRSCVSAAERMRYRIPAEALKQRRDKKAVKELFTLANRHQTLLTSRSRETSGDQTKSRGKLSDVVDSKRDQDETMDASCHEVVRTNTSIKEPGIAHEEKKIPSALNTDTIKFIYPNAKMKADKDEILQRYLQAVTVMPNPTLPDVGAAFLRTSPEHILIKKETTLPALKLDPFDTFQHTPIDALSKQKVTQEMQEANGHRLIRQEATPKKGLVFRRNVRHLQSQQPPDGAPNVAVVGCKAGSTVLHGFQHGPDISNVMWFDASGRAYVSLATRYDPVRK